MFKQLRFVTAPAFLSVLFTMSPLAPAVGGAAADFTFNMVASAAAKTCVPNATATVTIRQVGPVEIMDVAVQGLPPHSDFDLFVIQVPKAPFGISWFQGAIVADKNGQGHHHF